MIALLRELELGASVETLRSYHRDLLEEMHGVRALTSSAGWLVLSEMVHVNARNNSPIDKALTSLDMALQHNYSLGVANGLRQSLTLVDGLVAAYQERIDFVDNLLQEEQQNDRPSDPEPEPELASPDAQPDLFAP